MSKLILSLAVILSVASITLCAPAEDLVSSLPGLNFATNYQQYSGYLTGNTGHNLHYWFVESQNDPATDPVLLWLNGGPGCSSLLGLLTENGPFTVADDGATLVENLYSWNKVANVIFMESPTCVGFSYNDADNCVTDDDEVATNNYLALQDFFLNKFPEYFGNDFYVTGESYAGIYIPTLSVLIVDGLSTFPLQFQGYAIGNGITSYKNNDNSLLFYGYYHALFGMELWNNMVTSCCTNQIESPETCNFSESTDSVCQDYVNQGFNIIYSSGINHYNLYGTCDESTLEDSSPRTTEYTLAFDNLFRKHKKAANRPNPYAGVPCLDNANEVAYLNTDSVRTALHIPSTVQAWDVCSNRVSLPYGRVYDNITPQLAYLQSSVRGLLYSGDTDMAVNVLGNDWDIKTLNFVIVDDHGEWHVNGDVAGFVTYYENFDFVTVRGSGHMVPEYRPMEALHMITAFINNQPY